MRDLTHTGDRLEQGFDWLATRPWLALPLVLLLALPPLLVSLGAGDSNRTMENITVLSAQETWLRLHGSVRSGLEADPDAWLMPTRSGVPRVVKPPLVVWLDLLAFTGLRPGEATPQQLIHRARLVSVAMGLALIGAVYWAGWTLRGPRLALMAAAVCATMWFFQRQARIGSYDIHMAAWAGLAVAAALWAARGGRGRGVAGFALAGLFMGAATMSKGPLGIVVTLLPLAAMAVGLGRGQWRRWLAGVGGMLLITVAVTAPWYIYADLTVPTARTIWLAESRAQRQEFQTPLYYVALLGLVAPWSVWLLGGLFQPFTGPGRVDRRRLLWAWLWFVAIFVFFSIPGAKQQRYILPIVPAAALLAGQMWAMGRELADRGEVDPGINVLRYPHWIGLGVASLALPVLLVGFPQVIGAAPLAVAVLGGAAMLVLAALGAAWHWRWRPWSAFAATTAWALILTTLLWWAYGKAPERVHPTRAEAEKVDRAVGDAPLGLLMLPDTAWANEEVLLYSQRIFRHVPPSDLRDGTGGLWLVADDVPEAADLLDAAGYERVLRFEQERGLNRPAWLWRQADGEGD